MPYSDEGGVVISGIWSLIVTGLLQWVHHRRPKVRQMFVSTKLVDLGLWPEMGYPGTGGPSKSIRFYPESIVFVLMHILGFLVVDHLFSSRGPSAQISGASPNLVVILLQAICNIVCFVVHYCCNKWDGTTKSNED